MGTMPSAQPPAIAIESLTLSFKGRTVVSDFDLAVAPGETVVLSGPSGGGKSSILACLLGFLRPARGRIAIQGKALNRHTVWPLRRTIAWVPQEPDLGNGTVRAWVDAILALSANADAAVRSSRLPQALGDLGLDAGILERRAADISGGEKQRVALIVALHLERPILLLDEPTSALDADSRTRVCSRLRELRDTSVLVVSHQGNMDFADRSVALPSGENHHGRD